jgi:hypothetical protein
MQTSLPHYQVDPSSIEVGKTPHGIELGVQIAPRGETNCYNPT